MSDQKLLRRRIAELEKMQAKRLEMIEAQKQRLDRIAEKRQREIDNYRAQLMIGVVK